MSTEEIVVLPELKAYIDPLTPDEYEALERSILDEGCRDALVLWGNILVDGHNRYSICQKHGLPFKTMQNTRFQSMEDIHLWMIDQHLGRRSLSDFQRGVLALRKREIIAERRAQAAAAVQAAKAEAGEAAAAEAPWEGETDPVVAKALANVPKVPDEALDTREALARAARLSAGQVKMIETIQQKAAPEGGGGGRQGRRAVAQRRGRGGITARGRAASRRRRRCGWPQTGRQARARSQEKSPHRKTA